MDLKDYRRYLLVQLRAKPANVNRRPAALHRLCRWARAKGLIQDDLSEGIRGIEKERRLAPKALSRTQVHALRVAQRPGSKHDVTIMQWLRNTGVRVCELVALRLIDVVRSDRKWRIVVRWGRGRYREVGLNLGARQALAGYLPVRPSMEEDHLLTKQQGTGLTVRVVASVAIDHTQLANLPGMAPRVPSMPPPVGCLVDEDLLWAGPRGTRASVCRL